MAVKSPSSSEKQSNKAVFRIRKWITSPFENALPLHGIYSSKGIMYTTLALALCISVLLMLDMLSLSLNTGMSSRYAIVLFPLCLLLLWRILPRVFLRIQSLELCNPRPKRNVLSSWGVFIAVFALYGLRLACYDILRTTDTVSQWEQVTTGRFIDWHPVIHTFSLYVLSRPVEKEWFVLLCFAGIFSFLCMWLKDTLEHYRVRSIYVWITLVLLVLSPCSLTASRILWKDSAFALAVLYLSIVMIHQWHTHGEWLLPARHCVPMLFVSVYASFVRHNGIFFVIPLLLLLPLLAKKKPVRLKLCLISLLAFLGMAGYVAGKNYLAYHGVIENYKHQVLVESTGVPMAMMSEAFMQNPEGIPEKTRDFFLKIAPREEWQKHYKGDFNSMKFRSTRTFAVFSEITTMDFMRMFVATFISSPKSCLSGFLNVTALAWDPFLRTATLNAEGGGCLGFIEAFLHKIGLSWLLTAPGFYMVLLLLSGAYSLLKNGWKTLLMVLPFLAYTCGTALMLTGMDHRFFWAMILATPCVCLTLLQPRDDQECIETGTVEKKQKEESEKNK